MDEASYTVIDDAGTVMLPRPCTLYRALGLVRIMADVDPARGYRVVKAS